MRLSVIAVVVAALLCLYHIIQLPYTLSICFFILLIALGYVGYAKNRSIVIYGAFFGMLALYTVMGGYIADSKGISGTIVPGLLLGAFGTAIILFETLKPGNRR